jgi:Holliday junction DNA helicase RuvA
MFEYIFGRIVVLTPTYIVLENNGIGYFISITLNTYGALRLNEDEKIFVHQIVREDAHLLYGFKGEIEREVFRLLLSVSGIGANTARMILSAMSPVELSMAIANEQISVLQHIKGIGSKTAQRLIVELKDKIQKISSVDQNISSSNNSFADEALSALVMLGFPKYQVEKTLREIIRQHPQLSVEELIKMALKEL